MKFNNLMNQKKYTIFASNGPVATASASDDPVAMAFASNGPVATKSASFSTWGGGGE